VQFPVDFVCGYLVKQVPGVIFFFPVCFGRLQQGEGAYDVGAGKGERVCDAAVHVAFGSQVYDSVYVVLAEDVLHGRMVTDICPNKGIVGLVFNVFKVIRIGCIGELVYIDDTVLRVVLDKTSDHVRSNESAATGDENREVALRL